MLLRGYQKKLLADARDEMLAGRNRVLAVMATGGGKTATAAAAVRARLKRSQRIVWAAHRRELILQAANTLHAHGVAAGHNGIAQSAATQVISPQAAVARGRVPPADFVVLDECVTGETMIGHLRADEVAVGDCVPSYDGSSVVYRRVTHRFVRHARTLRMLTVSGRSLTLTDAHPVWTVRRGWIEAWEIVEGDLLRVRETNQAGDESSATLAKVDRVDVHEPGSDGTFGGRAPGGLVYNFEVDGEHNFFANGILTHNCHHFAADDWKRVVDSWPDADILGLTATPERGDGRALDTVFNTMVLGPQARMLVEMGYLVPVETYHPPRVQPPGKLAQEPVDAYLKAGLRGKRNIVFAPDVPNAERFAANFRAKGIRACVLTDKTPKAERDQMLRNFAEGRIHVIVNLFILTEGSDLPALEVVTLARPFPTAGGFIQAGGRGLRTSEETGKTHCTLLDLVGASLLHGDLLDEREYSLEGDPIKRKGHAGPSFCRTCQQLLVHCTCGAAQQEVLIYQPTNDPLVKYAHIRRDDEEARARRLSRWINESLARKHKWESALFKYKEVYGQWAPEGVVSQAKALAEGVNWCSVCKTSSCPHAMKKGAA